MIKEKVLSVIVGVFLGVVITLSVVGILSKDLLLGITLGSGLTMFVHERLKWYDNKNQDNHSLAVCTCVESEHLFCDEHDPRLLMTLSCNIPDEQLMTRLGLELSVKANTIRSCRENNKNSIEQATFHMLYHKWYKMQDGLGLESKGLKILVDALQKVHCDTYVQTIVQNHFLRR